MGLPVLHFWDLTDSKTCLCVTTTPILCNFFRTAFHRKLIKYLCVWRGDKIFEIVPNKVLGEYRWNSRIVIQLFYSSKINATDLEKELSRHCKNEGLWEVDRILYELQCRLTATAFSISFAVDTQLWAERPPPPPTNTHIHTHLGCIHTNLPHYWVSESCHPIMFL